MNSDKILTDLSENIYKSIDGTYLYKNGELIDDEHDISSEDFQNISKNFTNKIARKVLDIIQQSLLNKEDIDNKKLHFDIKLLIKKELYFVYNFTGSYSTWNNETLSKLDFNSFIFEDDYILNQITKIPFDIPEIKIMFEKETLKNIVKIGTSTSLNKKRI